MTFTEMINTVETTCDDFSTFSSKCDSFVEAVKLELDKNYKEVELKVIEESGDSDDKNKLDNAASEGALVKISKAITALIERFKEMMTKILKAVSEFFTSKSTEETLKKADEVIKSNPNIKNEKVEIPNTEATMKVYDEGINKLEKRLAEMKSGRLASDDEIEKIVVETEEKADKTKAVKITIAAASLVAATSGVFMYIKNNNPKDVKDVEEAAEKYETTDTPEQVAAKFKAISGISRLTNKKYLEAEDGLRSMVTRIKGFFSKKQPTDLPDVDGGKKHSKKNNDNDDIEESVQMTDEEKTEMISKIMEEVDESNINESDYVEESAYLSELESELFTEEDDYECTESYLDMIESEIAEESTTMDYLAEIEESIDDKIAIDDYLNVIEASLNDEYTEGVAKDAKKVFFMKTDKEFERVEKIIKDLKEKKGDLTYEEKMDLADEASSIISTLLSEVQVIPEDDFLDSVTSIKTYLNALKSIFHFIFIGLLSSVLSGGDVTVYSFKRYIDPHKQKTEAIDAIRKLQKQINKQIIEAEKEARKAEKEKAKAEKEVAKESADEIVDALLEELYY